MKEEIVARIIQAKEGITMKELAGVEIAITHTTIVYVNKLNYKSMIELLPNLYAIKVPAFLGLSDI